MRHACGAAALLFVGIAGGFAAGARGDEAGPTSAPTAGPTSAPTTAPTTAPTADDVPTATRATTRLDVQLDTDRRTIHGTVTLRAVNPTDAPLAQAFVWLYPNRFAHAPTDLNDINFYWIYPNDVSLGSMRVTRARGEGGVELPGAALRSSPRTPPTAGEGTLLEVTLPTPAPPGATFTLSLDFEANIPERYGTFGCTQGVCTLLGGFYPMLAGLAPSGWDLEAPPMRSRFDGLVTLARASAGVAFGRLERGTAIHLAAPGAPYVPLVVADGLFEDKRVVRGVTLEYFSTHQQPPADDAAGKALPYTEEDYGDKVLGAMGDAVDVLAGLGIPLPDDRRFTVVEAPLRLELAKAQPGMVVVSDRIFRLFPLKKLRRYHQRQLLRALFGSLYAERLAASGRESPRDVDLVADAVASYLVDLYTLGNYKSSEFAREMLQPLSFVPAVDELLYAPQVEFSDAYFGDVSDSETQRDDPRRFANQRPFGRLYYEKLRDLLSPEALIKTMHAVALDGKPFRAAAEEGFGGSLDWFFRQWSGPYPKVNYKLGRRWSEAVARGRWRWHVIVEKEGAPGDPLPIEPVRVRVVDGADQIHDLVWDGHGDRGELAFESKSDYLDSVEIDPGNRLMETAPPGSDDDPRFDNRSPPRWRFVYNNVGALVNVSDLSLTLAVDFSFRRVHDSRNTVRFRVYESDSTQVGANVRYLRGYGPQVTGNRRLRTLGVGLDYGRINPDFGRLAGEPATPGNRLTLSTAISGDSRLSIWEPHNALAWYLSGDVALTRYDGGSVRPTGTLSAGVSWIHALTPGIDLVGLGDAAVVTGDVGGREQLIAPGGEEGLRGFAPDALFGRAFLEERAELRFALWHDLDANVGHFVWLHSVSVAAFEGAGLLSGCDSVSDLVEKKSFLANVGLGLRFNYDDLGVQPGMTGLDIAFPIASSDRACLSTTPVSLEKRPFFIYLIFVPPW